MPQFDRRSAERISSTVQGWEGRTRELGAYYADEQMVQVWRWFELKETLAAGGTAKAKLCEWSVSGADGFGEYTPVDYEGYTPDWEVKDITGKFPGFIGDWVLCRPMLSEAGAQWEVVINASGGTCRFKLTAALALEGESAAAVLVIYDGATLTDTATVLEVYNPFHMFEGDVDAYGYARAMGDSGVLEIWQMVCP